MKVQVVRDRDGKAVASFEQKPAGALRLEPKVPAGHKVEEIEVPENYAANLAALYKK